MKVVIAVFLVVSLVAVIHATQSDVEHVCGIISTLKKAEQSSNLFWNNEMNDPGKAVDGDRNAIWNAGPGRICSHTNKEQNANWQVDLGRVHGISQVDIFSRGDGGAENLLPLKVETSVDDDTWVLCNAVDGKSVLGMVWSVPCVAVARYVRITQTRGDAEYLFLCEVEVHGDEPCPRTGMIHSNKWVATQSSEIAGGSASKAIDGNRNSWWGLNGNICQHTNADMYAWWKVDTIKAIFFNYVRIYNRGDGGGERLLPLKVEVSMDGSNWRTCNSCVGMGVHGRIYTLPCQATARYIRIMQTGTSAQYLHMCEVEFYV